MMAEPTGFSEATSAPPPTGVVPYPDARTSDANGDGDGHKPYVPAAETRMPEFTWRAVIVGSALGILFGASSLYLVLKVGMTVSASIPVAVLAITLFRGLSRLLPIRHADHPRKQHHADGRLGRRVDRLRRRRHHAGPDADRLRDGHHAHHGGVDPWRSARHPDDDPAAAGLHRQAARQARRGGQAALPRGHGLRPGADFRREGRHERQDGFLRVRDRFPPQVRHGGHEPAQDDRGDPTEEVQRRGRADRRHGFRIARRRLHHRRSHQRHHVRGGRAGVAGDRADDFLFRGEGPGYRGPGWQADRPDEHRRHSQRLHALHRRRLRGGGRHHQHVPDLAHDYPLLHLRRRQLSATNGG